MRRTLGSSNRRELRERRALLSQRCSHADMPSMRTPNASMWEMADDFRLINFVPTLNIATLAWIHNSASTRSQQTRFSISLYSAFAQFSPLFEYVLCKQWLLLLLLICSPLESVNALAVCCTRRLAGAGTAHQPSLLTKVIINKWLSEWCVCFGLIAHYIFFLLLLLLLLLKISVKRPTACVHMHGVHVCSGPSRRCGMRGMDFHCVWLSALETPARTTRARRTRCT